jgi:EAL domain-containing protein (putative c-di-GMP-specific phosphodiesterase class I)
VLRHACRQFKQWIDEGVVADGMDIAVNVSPRQFHRAEFVDQVLGILQEIGLGPDRLVLELTEGIVVENMGETIEKMRALKAHGIHFSIDDFGTGYSSLAYLKRLPIDQLKIDRSFVQDMCGDSNDRVIVETIIAMAQHLGLNVIAEGVETEEQLHFLERNGCQAYQGFHFSHPVSEEAFGAFLGSFRTLGGDGSPV